jgi:uncharacterized protein YkwD
MSTSRLHPLLLFGLAISLAVVPAEASAACRGSGQAVGPASPSEAERAVLCLINKERHRRGRRAVNSNSKLADAASAHSRDMVASGRFSHTGSNGSSPNDRVRRSGYLRGTSNWGMGETIGYQTGSGASPRIIVAGWLNSPAHRSIMLDRRYRDVGIGVKRGTPGGGTKAGGTYTADFGYR